MSRLCQFLWWLVLSGCTPAVAPALAPAVAPAVPSESPLHLRRCALGEHGYWAAVVRHTDRGHLLSLYLAAVPDQARDQDLLCELDWNAVLRVQPSRLQLVREPSCWVTGRIYGTAIEGDLSVAIEADRGCPIDIRLIGRTIRLSSAGWMARIRIPLRGGWMAFAYKWRSGVAFLQGAPIPVEWLPDDGA